MFRSSLNATILLFAAGVSSCSSFVNAGDAEVVAIDASRVESNSNNVQRVLYALSKDSADSTGKTNWYRVTEAGFNYVDTRCDAYFVTLFKLDRDRLAVRDTLSGFSQTTSAILAATGASGISLAVVAQAFGLGGRLVDISANSFLYRLPPDRTMKFVGSLQTAYRGGAYRRQNEIDSPSKAYHEIQSYLKLCMPPMIEAEIADYVADAQAAVVTTDGQARVVVGTGQSVAQKIEALRPLPDSRQHLPAPRPPQQTMGAITPFESKLPPVLLKQIQSLLCVPPTGVWNQETRNAFVAFYQGGEHPRPAITKDGVQQNDVTPKISEALQLYKAELPKSCTGTGDSARKYKSATELGQLMF
ncbi:hypothetical protein [Rhizobium sp. ZPR3]|uniref:Lipoprotein n=2 Tax=unclassified Rhizobium TaxID=2613769 RepID=A0AAU7SER1_9HYPH